MIVTVSTHHNTTHHTHAHSVLTYQRNLNTPYIDICTRGSLGKGRRHYFRSILTFPMETRDISDELDNSLSIECHSLDNLEQCKGFLTSSSRFKLLTLNIRSQQRNFDSFLVSLVRINIEFDIIILTECWLTDGSVIDKLPGYNAFRTTKFFNKSSGVVAYIKQSLSASAVEPPFDEANCLSIEIPNDLTILCIYRSPSVTNLEKFLNSLDSTLNQVSSRQIIVAGDINLDLMDNRSSSTYLSDYMCIMSAHGLIPAITRPTRLDACLDHIFVKSSSVPIGVVCKCSVSDHDIAMVGFENQKIRSNANRCILKTDYTKVALELSRVDWSQITSNNNLNEAANNFNAIVSTAILNHTNKVKISRSKFNLKPWITPGLIKCIKHRDRLHLLARASPNDVIIKEKYTRYRNVCDNILHSIKTEYNSKQFLESRGNNKKIWKTVKTLCENSKTTNYASELLKTKDCVLESLNECNLHFSTMGENLANRILTKLSETQSSLAKKVTSAVNVPNSFFLAPTDEFEVDKLIRQLKVDSAPGFDGCKPLLIKEIREVIRGPLTHLFNLSLQSGLFPECWKLSLVSPIYKSGVKNAPINFRPISLLCIFSKLLEKIVNIRLIRYMEKHAIISDKQFGFRSGKSTEDAAVLLTNLIAGHIDGGRSCLGIFLDLAKAFDTISIPVLLRKLELLGVRGTALDWFGSYLANRYQSVKIGESCSNPHPVCFGVPQGSILGPTLFNIYINGLLQLDMPNSDTICYADDTVVLFSGNTWEEAYSMAGIGLEKIISWLDSNLLTLNVEKTYYVPFSKTVASAPPMSKTLTLHNCGTMQQSPTSYALTPCNCPEVTRCSTVKYLGLLVDQHLSFKEHIHLVSKRIRKTIYIVKRLRNCAPVNILFMVYYALCQSVIQYCIAVWGSACKTYLLDLERAQRGVIKVMLKKPRRYPTSSLYKETGLLTVRQLYIVKAVGRTHNLIYKSQLHEHLLKKRVYRVPLPAVRSAFAKRSPFFAHPYIYNVVSKNLDIKQWGHVRAKRSVGKWLKTLTYSETENLLTPCT
jgi:hypothetical protein